MSFVVVPILRLFLEKGHCSVPLTLTINPKTDGNGTFAKFSGTATGAVGVFTYDLQRDNLCTLKLAVMFSVPFDRNFYKNWFAIGLFPNGTKCNHELYHRMYYEDDPDFVRGEAGSCNLQYQRDQIMIEATMAKTATATLKVEISGK